jgi:hypothetical protein
MIFGKAPGVLARALISTAAYILPATYIFADQNYICTEDLKSAGTTGPAHVAGAGYLLKAEEP